MWKQISIKRLAFCGMFIALGVVLGGLLSIPAFPLGVYSVKIGLGTLPVILSGVLFGPLYGGIVGGLTDFFQATLMPKGAYMPWFTLVGVLFGLIPGLVFSKRQPATLHRLFLAVLAGQTTGSIICNSALIAWLSGMPLWSILPPRIINQAFMIPIYTVLLYYLMPLIIRFSGLPEERLGPRES